MTTVQEIQAQTEQFKATVVQTLDGFARQGHVSTDEVDAFLASVGIERPEAPEVREAREELNALRTAVQAAVEAKVTGRDRDYALNAMGL